MDVHLTPELEKIIRHKLETGQYSSANEVVRDALHLMEQRDKVRQKIAEGFDSLREGKGIDGVDAFQQLDATHERYKRNRRG